jgi:hypothetical protein
MQVHSSIGTGKYGYSALFYLFFLFTSICRTIHNLVYNALKIFMDMDPALFEKCTLEYKATEAR